MKNPSGMPNAALAAAAHRIGSGAVGVGSGTGTITPPSGAHCRHAPLVMNSGTGARSVPSSGSGAMGSSAATIAAGTASRIKPPARTAASKVIARMTPTSGIRASA